MTEDDLIKNVIREQDDEELVQAVRVWADWLIDRDNPEGVAIAKMLDSKRYNPLIWPPTFDLDPTLFIEEDGIGDLFLYIEGWTDAFNDAIGVFGYRDGDGEVHEVHTIRVSERISIRRSENLYHGKAFCWLEAEFPDTGGLK